MAHYKVSISSSQGDVVDRSYEGANRNEAIGQALRDAQVHNGQVRDVGVIPLEGTGEVVAGRHHSGDPGRSSRR